MALPTINAIGNLTKDPELRFSKSGDAVASFRIACQDRYKVDGEWRDGDVTFIDVDSWHQSEAIVEQLSKGMTVSVSGHLRQRVTEGDDKRTYYSIKAHTVGAVVRGFTPPASESVAPF